MCTAAAPIRYPEAGPQAQHGEDLAVSLQLKEQGALHPLAEAPHLYVYVSHGANAWHDEHHRMLVDRLAVSKGMMKRREAHKAARVCPRIMAAVTRGTGTDAHSILPSAWSCGWQSTLSRLNVRRDIGRSAREGREN